MDLIIIIFKDDASNGDILHGMDTRIERPRQTLIRPFKSLLRANRMKRAGLNISNNYCHNAFGEGVQPWCYFKTGNPLVQEWGYCDIPTCEQFCGNPATVSPKPIVQGLKHNDPFVTCWNKCYQTGPLNGPKCMDDCMKVSSKTIFSVFSNFSSVSDSEP